MSLDKPFLNFVRAKSSSEGIFIKGSHDNDVEQGSLTGIEAKEFYDSLVKESVVKSARDDINSIVKEICSEKHEEVGNEEVGVATRRPSRKRTSASLSGSCKKTKERRTQRRSSCFKKPGTRDNEISSTVTGRLVNKFLQYAQEGHLNEMKTLFSETCIDINVTDQFSWTALMCAAHSGHTDVVRYLLDKGALWKGVVNSQGKDALDIARAVHNSTVIKLLEATELTSNLSRKHKSKSASALPKPFWCSVCKQEFTEDEKRHQSSTVHQFNCQHKPKGPHFLISEDNPGYKMMVKSGWDEEKGLGPEGEGRKFPIKTILKRDRYGLGNEESSKPRVTHFGPNDQSAVKLKKEKGKNGRKESNRTLSKKQQRLKESKDKIWERNMRIYMNS